MERQTLRLSSVVHQLVFAGVLVGLTLLLMPGTGWSQSNGEVRQAAAQTIKFHIEPAVIDLRAKAKTKAKKTTKKKKGKRRRGRGKGIWLIGSGLKPGQKVDVYVTMLGAESDISFMLRPKPKADAKGQLRTSWEIRPKRFSRVFDDKLTFEFRDSKTQRVLATAPLSVCKPSKGSAAPWCKSAQPLLPVHKKKKKKKRQK